MDKIKNNVMKLITGLIIVPCLNASLSVAAYPDHLEPCPVRYNTYHAAVFSSLLNNTHPCLWMIILAGNGKHAAVIIDERFEFEEIDQDVYELKSRRAFLKYISFKEGLRGPLGEQKYNPNDHYCIDLDNDLESCEIPIDSQFQNEIADAWTAVLKITKYSSEDPPIKDGPTYVFHCDRYYGYTVDPEGGLPALLVELGEKLYLLAKSEEKDRDSLRKQCLELAAVIEKTANPKKGEADKY